MNRPRRKKPPQIETFEDYCADLVDRLRNGKTTGSHLRWQVTDIHREAADLIEKLAQSGARKMHKAP